MPPSPFVNTLYLGWSLASACGLCDGGRSRTVTHSLTLLTHVAIRFGASRLANSAKDQGVPQVGRPIMFQGDVDSPDVTEQERRLIKRCAYCSSARLPVLYWSAASIRTHNVTCVTYVHGLGAHAMNLPAVRSSRDPSTHALELSDGFGAA